MVPVPDAAIHRRSDSMPQKSCGRNSARRYRDAFYYPLLLLPLFKKTPHLRAHGTTARADRQTCAVLKDDERDDAAGADGLSLLNRARRLPPTPSAGNLRPTDSARRCRS